MYTTTTITCGCKGIDKVLNRVIVIGDWPSETDEDETLTVETPAS